MNSWIKKWAKERTFSERKSFRATTIDEIHAFVNTTLRPVVSERITHDGFFMRLHRDDYHLDYYKFKKGVRNETLWVPIYNAERPVLTVLWYQSTQGVDFSGGNLRFHDGYTVKPEKNSAILFDSNEPHEVTYQPKGDRKVVIIKYY